MSLGGKMRFCVSISSKMLIMLCTSSVAVAFAVGTVSFFSADQAFCYPSSQHLVFIREIKKTTALVPEIPNFIAFINTKQWTALKFEAATDLTEHTMHSLNYSLCLGSLRK
jgi:hypothetical protein